MSLSEPEVEQAPLVAPKPITTILNKPTPTLIQAPLQKTLGQATSLINRANTDAASANQGATTFMVLTTSSMAAATQNGAVGIASSGTNTGTLTVKSSQASGNFSGAKTIVVMPVSNNYASGDGTTAKRFKIE